MFPHETEAVWRLTANSAIYIVLVITDPDGNRLTFFQDPDRRS